MANTTLPQATWQLSDWLHYLEQIHPVTIDMGLERVAQVAALLSFDWSASRVVIVGGTNGKGTTCRLVEQMLLAQGKTVAVYSSPHLIDYRERVRINNVSPPEMDFCQAFAAVEAVRGSISLTYFEFGTLAALWMMQQAKPAFIILEVGLGGRLDATNIVDADIAALTTIDLDHQEWLGDTREKIAREKAGIMRAHRLAVIGDTQPPQTLDDYVTQHHVNAWWQGREFGYSQQPSSWTWYSPEQQLDGLPIPSIPLQNASTAMAILSRIDMLPDTSVVARVLREVSLVGRRQKIASLPDTYVDVGHNPHAARGLLDWLNSMPYQRLHLVVGMLRDKAIENTIAELSSLNACWYLATTTGPRGCEASVLAKCVTRFTTQATTHASVCDAYKCAQQMASTEDAIVVFGSFHTVADVLALHRQMMQ